MDALDLIWSNPLYKQEQNGAAEQADVAPPQLVCDVPGLRLWHKADAEFQVPRANAYFLLTSPAAYDSPRAAALTHLTIKLLEVSNGPLNCRVRHCSVCLKSAWCVDGDSAVCVPMLLWPAWPLRRTRSARRPT